MLSLTACLRSYPRLDLSCNQLAASNHLVSSIKIMHSPALVGTFWSPTFTCMWGACRLAFIEHLLDLVAFTIFIALIFLTTHSTRISRLQTHTTILEAACITTHSPRVRAHKDAFVKNVVLLSPTCVLECGV